MYLYMYISVIYILYRFKSVHLTASFYSINYECYTDNMLYLYIYMYRASIPHPYASTRRTVHRTGHNSALSRYMVPSFFGTKPKISGKINFRLIGFFGVNKS